MESDDDYSRRLRIYRPFFQATPQRLLDVLNGPRESHRCKRRADFRPRLHPTFQRR